MTELQVLVGTVILGLVHIFAGTAAATQQKGVAWNAGTREGDQAPLRGVAFRLDQAMKNFFETYPLFLAALGAAYVAGTIGFLTALGAQVYFTARVLYLPIYAFGINYVRSLVWLVSIVGLTLVLASTF